MKTFTINGNEYKAKEFDLNTLCDLEDMGVSLDDMGKKQFSFLRAYFSLCSKRSLSNAGKELQEHLISDGNLDEFSEALSYEMEHSDFFQAMQNKAKEETTENQEVEKSKVKKSE